MPHKDKAQRAASNKAYRARPEVQAKRKAQRKEERARRAARRATESDEQYEARRARELERERVREARMSAESLAVKRAYRRAWHRSLTPEKLRRRRDMERARRIGTTVDVLYRLLEQQDYKCVLCAISLPRGEERLARNSNAEHLDHDHVTGRVRGILCGGCNTALGKLGDTFEGLDRARHYVSPPADPDCF